MAKKCRARPGMHSLARNFFVLLRKVPSYCNRTEGSTINSGSYRASNFKSAERVARGRLEITSEVL